MTLWTPSEITKSLWLDASDASTITIATGVSQWRDKSGNSRHANQATGANQPPVSSAALNGLNLIQLNGSSKRMATAAVALHSGYYSVFCVGKTVSATNEGLILDQDGYTGNRFGQYLYGLNPNKFGSATFNTIPTYFSTGAASVGTAPIGFLSATIFDTNKLLSLYINGTLGPSPVTVTDTVQTSVSTIFSIGAHWSGSIWQYYSDAGVGEIIVISGAVDSTTRQLIEGYLAWKWGLQASLPTDHHYKSAAPTVSIVVDISFYAPTISPTAFGGGVSSFQSPVLPLNASGGSYVAFDFPKTSPVSYGGGVLTFDSPGLSLFASGGGISSFNFPSPEIDSWKSISKGYFKSPKVSISASGGGTISFKGPRETVYSTGTFFNSGNISFNSHRIRVNAEGHVENVGLVSFSGPRIKVNVSGFSPTIGDISLSGPRMKVNADGLSSHGNISFSGPEMQIRYSDVVVHNYGILKYIKGQIR